MSTQVVELNCPGCGARISMEQKICEWCHKPLIISSFNSVCTMSVPEISKYCNSYEKIIKENPNNDEINKSMGMCYLKLKLFDKALSAFQRAIEAGIYDSEIFFYAAVCKLKGKKAFLAQRNDINQCIEYINAANLIEPRGIYNFFLAYIKYDFFERKYLNTSPNYIECLEMSSELGVSEHDINMLFEILSVEKPNALNQW